MKNHWLNKSETIQASFVPPLDYSDLSLDFFSAKHKIIEYLRAKHGLTDEALEHSVIQDLMDQWAYAADRLSMRANS